MEYKIISSGSPEQLSSKVNEHITNGWKPVGGHTAVEIHRRQLVRGEQHMDTIIKVEYSQTIIKD